MKVPDVLLEKGQELLTGTLHLTVHNLIFNHADGELWVSLLPFFMIPIPNCPYPSPATRSHTRPPTHRQVYCVPYDNIGTVSFDPHG